MSNANTLILEALRARYRVHVAKLMTDYPAQIANVNHYAHKAETAKLGRVRRDITTKGELSTFVAGEFVLAWPSSFKLPNFARNVGAWHPRNPIETSLDSTIVEVL